MNTKERAARRIKHYTIDDTPQNREHLMLDKLDRIIELLEKLLAQAQIGPTEQTR